MSRLAAVASLGLTLTLLMMLPVARGSEADQATKLTFNQSVHLPARVLPAGTYWFVVPAPGFVQIFNSDRSQVITTLQDISAERSQATGKTEITFVDRGEMQPAAIVTWFYPGRTTGHEFVYAKQESAKLARNKPHTIVAGY